MKKPRSSSLGYPPKHPTIIFTIVTVPLYLNQDHSVRFDATSF